MNKIQKNLPHVKAGIKMQVKNAAAFGKEAAKELGVKESQINKFQSKMKYSGGYKTKDEHSYRNNNDRSAKNEEDEEYNEDNAWGDVKKAKTEVFESNTGTYNNKSYNDRRSRSRSGPKYGYNGRSSPRRHSPPSYQRRNTTNDKPNYDNYGDKSNSSPRGRDSPKNRDNGPSTNSFFDFDTHGVSD